MNNSHPLPHIFQPTDDVSAGFFLFEKVYEDV